MPLFYSVSNFNQCSSSCLLNGWGQIILCLTGALPASTESIIAINDVDISDHLYIALESYLCKYLRYLSWTSCCHFICSISEKIVATESSPNKWNTNCVSSQVKNTTPLTTPAPPALPGPYSSILNPNGADGFQSPGNNNNNNSVDSKSAITAAMF